MSDEVQRVELYPYKGDLRRRFEVRDYTVSVAGILKAKNGGFSGVTVDVGFVKPLSANIVHSPRGLRDAEQALEDDERAQAAVRDGIVGLIEVLGFRPF